MAKRDLSASAFAGKEAENTQFESMYYRPKISINGHRLVLWLEETNNVVAAVVQKYTNLHHAYILGIAAWHRPVAQLEVL